MEVRKMDKDSCRELIHGKDNFLIETNGKMDNHTTSKGKIVVQKSKYYKKECLKIVAENCFTVKIIVV